MTSGEYAIILNSNKFNGMDMFATALTYLIKKYYESHGKKVIMFKNNLGTFNCGGILMIDEFKSMIDEKEKDDVTWAADRLWDTYKRHCEKNGDEYISYEEFTENLKRSKI
jgi:hypothetical protein